MRGATMAMLVTLLGCHVTASNGDGTGAVDARHPDGSVFGGDDGNPGGGSDAPATATCANGRVVYLNFEGQALTQATASDATQNLAGWMTATPGAAPKWNKASANRATDIATIVAGVQSALSTGFPGPITVTTTRPATGPYIMVVYGGTATQVHSAYGAAVNKLDCGDTAKSDVAWIRDVADPVNTTSVINTTLGAIGFGLGLTATNDPTDCMCSWANQCVKDQTQICTLHDGIARDPGQAGGGTATQTCQGAGATQDEHAAFVAAFCQ